MDIKVAFHILEIEQTKDEAPIREAYRRLIQVTNPEDDQEGFKRLREAYDTAMEYTRATEEEQEKAEPVTDVDFFMVRMEEIYADLRLRLDIENWKELLSDPVCEGLDTSMEVRQRVLDFFTDNIHIPHEAWKLFDETFEIVDDIENLKEEYYINFLNYIKNHVENEDAFPYYALEYKVDDVSSVVADDYIKELMRLKSRLDSLENMPETTEEEANERHCGLSECVRELEDLEAFGIYHPYQVTLMLLAATLLNDTELMEEYCDKISDITEEFTFAALTKGEALWNLGKHEEAYTIWMEILEKEPDYYEAKFNVVRYLMENKKYYEAREKMKELVEIYDQDERVQALYKEASEAMIEDFLNKLSNGEEDENYPGYKMILELAWCYLANDRTDEAVKLLEENEPADEEHLYSYTNLFGRSLYYNKEYERALLFLEKWADMLMNMQEDGTEETAKRLTRKNVAFSLLSCTYRELGDMEKAVEMEERAIEEATDFREKLNSMYDLSSVYFAQEQYEKVIEVCDAIIQEDEGYYPAYVTRQEASFKLERAQEVIDDYYMAVDIFPGYYKPYLLAAEIYYNYNQFDDGISVITRAEENGIELTPKMMLLKAKLLRDLAESDEDREAVSELLIEISKLKSLKKKDPDRWDIEDDSELTFERALLHWDNGNLEKAQVFMQKAIKENPDRGQYHLVLGNLLVDMEHTYAALKEYDLAEKDYENTPNLYYGRALAYKGACENDKAIECFEKVLELRNSYGRARFLLADLYSSRYMRYNHVEDYHKSLECACKLIEENPNGFNYIVRGLYYLRAMELDEAIADFEAAIEVEEDSIAAWNDLGCCYLHMGQYEKAVECFAKAIENEQSSPSHDDYLSYGNMGETYESMGQYEKAIEYYELYEKLHDKKHVPYCEDKGRLYEYLGRYDEAEEAYKDFGTIEYYINLGNIALRQGDKAKAIELFDKSIDVTEDEDDKAKNMCTVGMNHMDYFGDVKTALEYLNKAYESARLPLYKYNALRDMSRVYMQMKDEQQAEKYARKALEIFEEAHGCTIEEHLEYKAWRPARLGSIAWLYLALGEKEKAISMIEDMDKHTRCAACKCVKCFEKPLFLADFYMIFGDTEKAKELYEETLRRAPMCMEARNKLERLNKGV